MRALRKDMQIIFQDPYSSLNPRISIGKSIMEPMQVHNMLSSTQERKDRVLELLKKVGLEENTLIATHMNLVVDKGSVCALLVR